MNNLYLHGEINCKECFAETQCTLENGWELNNNPSYWGASNPKILILGYSKGKTQMNNILEFDSIAFKGMRSRLKQILVSLNLINDSIDIDTLFKVEEKKFGFASLIRCGISKNNKTSGSLIVQSFKNDCTQNIISNCIQKFLNNNIPDSVEKIILLGSSKEYMKLSMLQFEKIFSDFKKTSENSFFAKNINWTYVAHPSPANGHFNKWIEKHLTKQSSQ